MNELQLRTVLNEMREGALNEVFDMADTAEYAATRQRFTSAVDTILGIIERYFKRGDE